MRKNQMINEIISSLNNIEENNKKSETLSNDIDKILNETNDLFEELMS